MSCTLILLENLGSHLEENKIYKETTEISHFQLQISVTASIISPLIAKAKQNVNNLLILQAFQGQTHTEFNQSVTHLELSVALSVFEHVQEKLCTFLGPTALSPAKLLGLKTQPIVRGVSNHRENHITDTSCSDLNRFVSS